MKRLPLVYLIATLGCGRAAEPPPVVPSPAPEVSAAAAPATDPGPTSDVAETARPDAASVAPDDVVIPTLPAADASAAAGAGEAAADLPPETLAAATASCEAGDVYACFRAGWQLVHGQGVAVDQVRGRALVERACDGEVPNACGLLGLIHEFGKGVPVDRAAAFRYYRRGCALGEIQVSCFNAGRFQLASSDLSPRERSEAMGWLRSACDTGLAVACFDVGYELGRQGGPDDPARGAALQWYRRACELGNSDGCTQARALERAGRSSPRPDVMMAPSDPPGPDAGP